MTDICFISVVKYLLFDTLHPLYLIHKVGASDQGCQTHLPRGPHPQHGHLSKGRL